MDCMEPMVSTMKPDGIWYNIHWLEQFGLMTPVRRAVESLFICLCGGIMEGESIYWKVYVHVVALEGGPNVYST